MSSLPYEKKNTEDLIKKYIKHEVLNRRIINYLIINKLLIINYSTRANISTNNKWLPPNSEKKLINNNVFFSNSSELAESISTFILQK